MRFFGGFVFHSNGILQNEHTHRYHITHLQFNHLDKHPPNLFTEIETIDFLHLGHLLIDILTITGISGRYNNNAFQ